MANAVQLRQNIDAGNVATIQNLPTGVAAGDAVNVAQLQAAIESLIINFKDSARAAATGNVDIANPGATFDGIALTSGDRLLLSNQTLLAQNGIYIFNGASTPLTRAQDADTFEELEVAIVAIEEGTTQEATILRQTQLNGVIDVDDVLFVPFLSATPPASETVAGVIEIATQAEVDAGAANNLAITPLTLSNFAGRKLKFSTDIGDGTNTVFNVTHNLNTEDVQIEVYSNNAPQDSVIVARERIGANTVRICFSTPPTANEFRVVVLG